MRSRTVRFCIYVSLADTARDTLHASTAFLCILFLHGACLNKTSERGLFQKTFYQHALESFTLLFVNMRNIHFPIVCFLTEIDVEVESNATSSDEILKTHYRDGKDLPDEDIEIIVQGKRVFEWGTR